ncbi:MAG: nicotinate (nicotinamide) nucleotide adenylyltransferase [Betaproteobacteria bacterium]|nr:nicotinate (nicotinamide) nucleotide adenylyltransferase [Betaproteobacteria bacterium]
MKTIGLFGGTFDPVHNGHLAVMREARQVLGLDEFHVLPASDPWQKSQRVLAPAAHRVAMLERAVAHLDQVHIDRRELDRHGPTYTFDTLAEVRAERGADCALFWLIGSDAFARLSTWHRAAELPGLAHFAVVARKDSPGPFAGFAEIRRARQTAHGMTVAVPIDAPDVSSTQIRARIARGEPIRGLTPEPVCDYIETHRLYQENPSLGQDQTDRPRR